MQELIRKNCKNAGRSKGQELSEAQSHIVNVSLNNYAYFVADMTTLKNKYGNLTEQAIQAKDKLRELLPELKHTLERLDSGQKHLKSTHYLRETILWTKLHLGKEYFKEFDSELNDLKTNQIYTDIERKRVSDNYDKHKAKFPELWEESQAARAPSAG